MSVKKITKRETNFTYTNKFNKKKMKFRPKEGEFVVTFHKKPAEDTIDTISTTRSLELKRTNLEREIAVFRSPAGQDIQESVSSLEDETNVANSMPVMVDTEGLERHFVPDESSVQFIEGISKSRAKKIIKEIGSSIVVQQRTPGYYTISVPEGKGLFETIRELSEMEEVEFAEPSEVGFNDALAYIPNDSDFGRLWGLRNTGQTVDGVAGTKNLDIKAIDAWELSQGASDIIVAVIDTGADLDHPDLEDNLLSRGNEDWDFAANDDVPEDEASGTHGTHVAGTVAAVDNTIGVIGVCPRCQIMPLRINLTSGMNANRADAINYVADQASENGSRRYVINCSWKMSGDHSGVHKAIQNAVKKNVVVIFAAGNDIQNIDTTPQYPAVYPEVIAVAATDQDDEKASFSNYGKKVDVSAPGVNIWSTIGGGSHGFKDGTSMAAPHVSGLAALIWSVNPSLTNNGVRQIIEDTCDDIDDKNTSFKGELGKGRINAARALSAAAWYLYI